MKQNYKEFVEKFKPKKTTDDCYTPDAVYETVKNWAVKEYHLDGREIVRPFWPGGDYENFKYPDGCVVIDNPPFSILSKIKAFYAERGIDYFLFAPHLTLFSSGEKNGERYIVVDTQITYANGAKVNTDFVTNLDTAFIRTAPDLKRLIEAANRRQTKTLPKYRYPDTVISAALLGKIANVEFCLDETECAFTRALDAQKAMGKSIFGSGFLISGDKAAEFKAAELRAAEKATEWELSNREKEIIKHLR